MKYTDHCQLQNTKYHDNNTTLNAFIQLHRGIFTYCRENQNKHWQHTGLNRGHHSYLLQCSIIHVSVTGNFWYIRTSHDQYAHAPWIKHSDSIVCTTIIKNSTKRQQFHIMMFYKHFASLCGAQLLVSVQPLAWGHWACPQLSLSPTTWEDWSQTLAKVHIFFERSVSQYTEGAWNVKRGQYWQIPFRKHGMRLSGKKNSEASLRA